RNPPPPEKPRVALPPPSEKPLPFSPFLLLRRLASASVSQESQLTGNVSIWLNLHSVSI
ncbi:hypothetical protein A2U01_0087218, partial [Trifolium medium]|nr:hypothetical protein [Trifolium medium]